MSTKRIVEPLIGNDEHKSPSQLVSTFERILQARRGDRLCLPDDDSRLTLPVVWEFLTRNKADATLEKELATVSVKLGLGEWIIDLSDPGLAISVSATSPSLTGVFAALEACLTGPNPPIRPWKGQKAILKKVKTDEKTTQVT